MTERKSCLLLLVRSKEQIDTGRCRWRSVKGNIFSRKHQVNKKVHGDESG